MPQPFSWQLKCQNWSLDPRGVVSAVVAVTNELSKVTKQAFTYDNPFEEMGDNYILVNSNTFSKIHSWFQLAR